MVHLFSLTAVKEEADDKLLLKFLTDRPHHRMTEKQELQSSIEETKPLIKYAAKVATLLPPEATHKHSTSCWIASLPSGGIDSMALLPPSLTLPPTGFASLKVLSPKLLNQFSRRFF
jgi:hypothetical protein